MGGVDVSDKCVYHTSINRQTSKYWKRIFYNLVDISIFNAHVLYKANTNRPKERREFIIDLIESLSGVNNPVVPVAGPGGDTGNHKLERLPLKQEKTCVVCSHTKPRGRSKFWCTGCNSGCHRECFHLQQHFWRPKKGGRKRKAPLTDSE